MAHGPSSKARRASATARPNSAMGVADTSARWDSSAGFSTATVSSPSIHRPATYDRRSLISVVKLLSPVRRFW